MPIDDGVIKFNYNLKPGKSIEEDDFLLLEKWRTLLFSMSLIGEYKAEKIGYGNISKRLSTGLNEFVITGSQTGRFASLKSEQYCKVIKCDLEKSKILAIGPIAPSSESLTHYAIYQDCPQISFVFHVHHDELWEKMLEDRMDKTDKSISYGTIKMAMATKELIQNKRSGIFVMEGHQGGVISYGESAEQAGSLLLDTYKIVKD
ncbi:MAG: L-ribulose-5-phosphate 4-epimerase [Thermoproteota archaeon]|jgi:L-ribulose-5-phosphate 4-epimerase